MVLSRRCIIGARIGVQGDVLPIHCHLWREAEKNDLSHYPSNRGSALASITKTAHNKHLVRIRITGFPVISKQFDSLKDAQVFAKKTEADMLRGRFVDLRPAEQTTLRSVIDDYLLAETVLKRGAAAEKLRLQKISRDEVADYALANLSARSARDYRDKRLKQVGAATVIRELNLLAVVVKWAIRELAISLHVNPFD